MIKRVVVAGLLAFVVLTLWAFVANVLFGFTARTAMNRVADERAVHRVLRENIASPGLYLVNPALTADWQFPPGEPVFGVSYSGMGHDAAGPMMFVGFGLVFVTTLLVAGLLSVASPGVQASWAGRTGFVLTVGVVMAVAADLSRVGIGGYPFGTAAARAAVHVAGWGLAGLAMAWVMRPTATAPGRE